MSPTMTYTVAPEVTGQRAYTASYWRFSFHITVPPYFVLAILSSHLRLLTFSILQPAHYINFSGTSVKFITLLKNKKSQVCFCDVKSGLRIEVSNQYFGKLTSFMLDMLRHILWTDQNSVRFCRTFCAINYLLIGGLERTCSDWNNAIIPIQFPCVLHSFSFSLCPPCVQSFSLRSYKQITTNFEISIQ